MTRPKLDAKPPRSGEYRRGQRVKLRNDAIRDKARIVAREIAQDLIARRPDLTPPLEEIFSKTRRKAAVQARRAIAYALRQQGFTEMQIGFALGRDHTTAHALLQNVKMCQARPSNRWCKRTLALIAVLDAPLDAGRAA